MAYPITIELAGRLCVVVGGGPVAERKVRGLLADRARVRVVSPASTPWLAQAAGDGQVEWLRRPYRQGDLAGAFLVFCATDDRGVNAAAVAEARAARALVNVADAPDEGDFTVPASHRLGPITLAVSTGGESPVAAREIRDRLAEALGPDEVALVARRKAERKKHAA